MDYKKYDSKNNMVNLTDQDVIQAHRQRMMGSQSPKEIRDHQRYLIIRHIARSDQKPEVRLADADRLFKDEPLTSKEVAMLTGMSLKKVNQIYNNAMANIKIKYREIYEDV